MATRGNRAPEPHSEQQLELDAVAADSMRPPVELFGSDVMRRRSRGDRGTKIATEPTTPAAPTIGRRPTLPRLSVSPGEAAQMLGVSRDFFDEHIKPELRIVRRGSKTILIPVAELQRWLDKSATRFPR
jgi:excisionase family DNA binding protein